MNLRARASRLFGRSLEENAVDHSKVDRAILNDIRKRATKLDDAFSTPPQLPDGDCLDGKVWERLCEDVFYSYFDQDQPRVRARDKVDKRFHVNREVASRRVRDEHFQEQHATTRGQSAESALGTMGALHSLAQSYGRELAEHAKTQNEIADAQDEIASIDDMLEKLREQRQQAPARAEDIDAQIRRLAASKRQVVGDLKDAEGAQARMGGSLQDAVATAVEKAVAAGDEAIEAAALTVGKGAGAGRRIGVEQAFEFTERIIGSRVLKDMLAMMGRLEVSMGSVRRQLRKGGFEEMVDIETGDDLRLVLAHEKALLAHPVAKLDFMRRFVERSLMQYEMHSEQELKRGPVIFAADGSDSMRGAPNIFCRGLTLASCMIGHKEGRNTAAIEFGSTGQLRTFFFPKDGPFDMATALDFGEHFFAGGTDINSALAEAERLIDSEAPFHSADLVIVTDGGDYLTDESLRMRDKLRAMGVKIHGLVIGATPTEYVLAVCDQVSSVFDYAGPNQTSDQIAINLT